VTSFVVCVTSASSLAQRVRLAEDGAADGEPRVIASLLLSSYLQVAARPVFSLSGLGPIRVTHSPNLAAPLEPLASRLVGLREMEPIRRRDGLTA
jgi:hypothetical protein